MNPSHNANTDMDKNGLLQRLSNAPRPCSHRWIKGDCDSFPPSHAFVVFSVFFPTMRHSSLHNYKHFVYADYCVIKKDILLAVASQRKLQGRTAD